MFKQSDFVSKIEEQLDSNQIFFESSDKDSNNPRDVNLNLKMFTDCNLLETAQDIKKDNSDLNFQISTEKEVMSNFGREDLQFLAIGADSSIVEPEGSDKTYVIAKSIISRNASLTDEEISKKFYDLSFAFKTDAFTIQKRLHLMKRKRDQAESNIENEIKAVKVKLKNLQFLGLNSDHVNLMSDLKNQLDFILNATIQLSSSAESYGYVQHEERFLESVTIMLQHVENLENLKNETSKILDKLKAESKRSQATISLGSDKEEEKLLRRKSVIGMPFESKSRRRASIATLPRIGSSILDSNTNMKESQFPTSCRFSGSAAKKLSFSQASASRNLGNSSPGINDFKRDSTGSRHKIENWASESSVQNMQERSEQKSLVIAESESFKPALDANSVIGENDSSLQLRQLFESIDEIKRDSFSQENVNIIYCLRRIIEWNKLLLSATRFRWPDSFLHFIPFYITWYIVFLLTLVFISGVFTGINGCFTYLRLQYSPLWFGVLTFFILAKRAYRFVIILLVAVIFILFFLLFLLTYVALPKLTDQEIDQIFKTFGLAFEIRYPYGFPPI